jgi:hypothetical protein
MMDPIEPVQPTFNHETPGVPGTLGAGSASYFAPEAEIPPPSHDFSTEPSGLAGHDLQGSGIQGMVRQQLEEAIQKAARELLPQIAERIIKQEISRLLNEVP